jgi:hypothetical protein
VTAASTQRFIAGSFVAAACLLWFGWALLPIRIGAFFEAGVSERIQRPFHSWIWMYRLHLFGMVMMVVALGIVIGRRGLPGVTFSTG